jgi:hypothetical protein
MAVKIYILIRHLLHRTIGQLEGKHCTRGNSGNAFGLEVSACVK